MNRQKEEEKAAWRSLRLFLGRYIEEEEDDRPSITPLQAALLMGTVEARRLAIPPLNQTQLAQLLHSSEPTISANVIELQENGLCKVKSDPKNRKNNHPEATRSGKRELMRYAKAKFGSPAEAIHRLTEISEYGKITTRFDEILDDYFRDRLAKCTETSR